MQDPLRLLFQALALGHFAGKDGALLPHELFEPHLILPAGRDVLHREEDELEVIDAAGVQHDRAQTNPLKVMSHEIVIEDRIAGQNLFQ